MHRPYPVCLILVYRSKMQMELDNVREFVTIAHQLPANHSLTQTLFFFSQRKICNGWPRDLNSTHYHTFFTSFF